MPSKAELAKRGGVRRIRTKRLPNGDYVRIYVVDKPGPRGGRTVAGEPQKPKSKRK